MANAANKPVNLVLLAGGNYQERESWIAADLLTIPEPSGIQTGIILEGLPCGIMPLQSISSSTVERIAPGCFCCIGNLVLRVTLNRVLRQKPDRLYLAMNDQEHLSSLQSFLETEPYLGLLMFERQVIL